MFSVSAVFFVSQEIPLRQFGGAAAQLSSCHRVPSTRVGAPSWKKRKYPQGEGTCL